MSLLYENTCLSLHDVLWWRACNNQVKVQIRERRGVNSGQDSEKSFPTVVPPATNKINIWLYKRGSSCTLTQTHKSNRTIMNRSRWVSSEKFSIGTSSAVEKKEPSSHSGKTAVVSLTGHDHGKLSSYHHPDGAFALIHSVTQSCKNAKYAPVPWAWRLWGLYFLCITWQLFSISSPEATEIGFESLAYLGKSCIKINWVNEALGTGV